MSSHQDLTVRNGIIQEVYRKVAAPLIIEIDDNDVPVIPQAMVDDAFKELIDRIEQKFASMRIPYNKFNIATQMREFNKAQEHNLLLADILTMLRASPDDGSG